MANLQPRSYGFQEKTSCEHYQHVHRALDLVEPPLSISHLPHGDIPSREDTNGSMVDHRWGDSSAETIGCHLGIVHSNCHHLSLPDPVVVALHRWVVVVLQNNPAAKNTTARHMGLTIFMSNHTVLPVEAHDTHQHGVAILTTLLAGA